MKKYLNPSHYSSVTFRMLQKTAEEFSAMLSLSIDALLNKCGCHVEKKLKTE